MSSQDLPTPVMDAGDSAPAPSPSKSNRPSILNTGSIPTNTAMKVQSDVLEPLTFSQSECVFRLQPRGILHPGSSITVACDVQAGIARAFPYLNIGIHSLIRRAVLRTTAGRVINDTDEYHKLQSVKSMFVQNSVNKEREQLLTGRQMDYELIYDVKSDVKSGLGFGISNGYEYCDSAVAGARQGLSVRPELLNSKSPEFRIKLHDLFEYCRQGNQLPLFLLPDEQLEVVLYWADAVDYSSRLAVSKGDDANVAQPVLITKSKCKMIADYVYYAGDIMDEIRSEFSRGMTFSYTDYRLSQQSVSGGAGGTSIGNTRNIGGNGMAVSSVYWGHQLDRNGTFLIGPYNSLVPTADGTAGGKARTPLKSNLFVNGEYLYPQDITNPARQFHNLKETAGMIPFVPRCLYSDEGSDALTIDASYEFEGRPQRSQFSGEFFHQGFRLSGLSQRIDNRGIDLHSDCEMGAGTYNLNAWIEVKKYVVITDGHLECYYV